MPVSRCKSSIQTAQPPSGLSSWAPRCLPALSLAPAWFLEGVGGGIIRVGSLCSCLRDLLKGMGGRPGADTILLYLPASPLPLQPPKGPHHTRKRRQLRIFLLVLLPVSGTPASSHALQQLFFLRITPPTPPYPLLPHCLEVPAVWQCPGSAELDSIPGFVSFFKIYI